MNILAIDPANRTGYAHSNGAYGVWTITHPMDQHPGRRLVRFRDELRRVFEAWGFDLLAFEDAAFGSNNSHTEAMHNELRGVLLLTASSEFDVPVLAVNPTALKAFATGSGRAKKPQMIRAAETMLGIVTGSSDVADACWVLEFAKQKPIQLGDKTAKRSRRRTNKLSELF